MLLQVRTTKIVGTYNQLIFITDKEQPPPTKIQTSVQNKAKHLIENYLTIIIRIRQIQQTLKFF